MRARATAAALLLAAACTAGAGPALAASTPPKATKVSYAKLRADVAAGKGTVAEINRVAHSVELVMTDRKREKAVYPSHDEKQFDAYLRRHHVPVVFRHHHSHKASGGHPLRYAALALALIAIALAVLLLARRRRPRVAEPPQDEPAG